jgi:hypothetical protein
LSQQLQLCASPPRFRVFGVSFHPPGFLLRLPSCAPSTQFSSWILFFFLVSFPWFWVSLSSFLLLSPLLEPSLFFFFVVCQVPAGGRRCNTTKKKKMCFSVRSNYGFCKICAFLSDQITVFALSHDSSLPTIGRDISIPYVSISHQGPVLQLFTLPLTFFSVLWRYPLCTTFSSVLWCSADQLNNLAEGPHTQQVSQILRVLHTQPSSRTLLTDGFICKNSLSLSLSLSLSEGPHI